MTVLFNDGFAAYEEMENALTAAGAAGKKAAEATVDEARLQAWRSTRAAAWILLGALGAAGLLVEGVLQRAGGIPGVGVEEEPAPSLLLCGQGGDEGRPPTRVDGKGEAIGRRRSRRA